MIAALHLAAEQDRRARARAQSEQETRMDMERLEELKPAVGSRFARREIEEQLIAAALEHEQRLARLEAALTELRDAAEGSAKAADGKGPAKAADAEGSAKAAAEGSAKAADGKGPAKAADGKGPAKAADGKGKSKS